MSVPKLPSRRLVLGAAVGTAGLSLALQRSVGLVGDGVVGLDTWCKAVA